MQSTLIAEKRAHALARDSKVAIKSAAGAINSKSCRMSTLALHTHTHTKPDRHNNNNNNSNKSNKCRVGSLVCRRVHKHTGQKCIKTVRIYVSVCACACVCVQTCVYGGKLMAHKIITERT